MAARRIWVGCKGVCVICLSLHLHVVELLLNSDLVLLDGLARSGWWRGDVMDCGGGPVK